MSGLKNRRWGNSKDWEKNLHTSRLGIEVTGQKPFGLRVEAYNHSDSDWIVALGVSFGIV